MMDSPNFDDFFEPEEENGNEFDFIDNSTLQRFQRNNISIEKIQKEIYNFDEEDDDEIYGEKATRKFEFQIQVNRILQIFDEMIKKIETLLCMQELVKDKNLMKEYFSDKDIADLTKYCSMKNLEVDFSEGIESENVARLVQLILNSDINVHSDNYKNKISVQKKMFLSSIKELRNIICSRLQLTAPKDFKKEQILHQMWKKYEKNKEKIANLKERWQYRKQNFEEKMADKYETIERYKQEIEVLKQENEIEIHDQIQDSNVNIIHFCKLKDGVIEEKYSIAEEAKESYKSLLNENLDNEKKLRERKDKAIQSLQAILHKFDVEVGEERTRELDDLKSTLEAQRKEFFLWQTDICEPQIKLHAQLMHEKDEAERQEFQAALLLFMMNRSAKIIQKYWRNMCARRKKKGKKKGRLLKKL